MVPINEPFWPLTVLEFIYSLHLSPYTQFLAIPVGVCHLHLHPIQSTYLKTPIKLAIESVNDYTVRLYRSYDTVINRDQYVLVDGLVVDGANGRIGFCNHTIPQGLAHRATWEKDLLWIKPDTVYIDSNLTFEYTFSLGIGGRAGNKWSEVTLIEKGGFRNLTEGWPLVDFNDTQTKPELFMRGWKAASLNNFNLMRFLNLTTGGRNDVIQDLLLCINLTDLNSTLGTVDPNWPVLMSFSDFMPLPGLYDSSRSNKTIDTGL
jgi:hypothetical protein